MSSERRKPYPFDEIEPKWQRVWEERQMFHAPNPGEKGFDPSKPKFYVLDMFPYPSGAGLHVGHPEGYTATDIVARYKRFRGFNVLHPMGWDAFGLPAEQYAIKTGQHPAITTRENVAKFKSQLKAIGFSYDWQREVNTTDPRYFKWTQWIFLQIYNSWFNPQTNKAEPISTYGGEDPDRVRLAYVADVPVNWCPELGTVLANEEVVDGKSEVGGFPVVRRPMRQWMLRITAFAERLIDELAGLDWPEGIKLLQRNWIGKSEGAEIDFAVAGIADAGAGVGEPDYKIRVFTTRPDTLYGATYMVLAPEHSLVDLIVTEEQWPEVREYRERTARKSDLERTELAKEKTGVFTGAFAINPANEAKIPIWIADYVLLGYGTGAIMGVPAHDERDLEFARKFDLPIIEVVRPAAGSGIGFQPMIPNEQVEIRQGAHLPHWTQEGATYAVTFRLVDSLPQSVLKQWESQRRDIAQAAERQRRPLNEQEESRLAKLFSTKVEAYLDAGHGECWLRDGRIASLVREALLHFDRGRYEIAAWCVMPNHVHVIVRPKIEYSLSQILHSWKSFTAKKANGLLHRQGPFWQPESYDHLIRSEEEFRNQIRYVLENPKKAGLESWHWAGRSADVEAGSHRQDADATAFVGEGTAINSPIIDGLPSAEAKRKITAWLEQRGQGKRAINYKLRDWLFSRQRYWGEPFPIVWENGKHRSLAEDELPVVPPPLEDYKPTGTGEPPLAKAKDWIRYSEKATRETNVMPQWAGSCWYYLRFCDPQNDARLVGEEAERYWSDSTAEAAVPGGRKVPAAETAAATAGTVDLYVGGTEHAVLHLLYARFWHKVLFDLGYVSKPEPFQRLVNQGIILGEDNQKMSKSRGNIVNPDDVIAQYGADAFRLYEMFMGPLEQMKPWSMRGVEGVARFLARVWRLIMSENQAGQWELSPALQDVDLTKAQQKITHATVKKVTEDIESLSFNTAISQMMIFVNAFTTADAIPIAAMRTFLVLLNPFAPHLSSELWERLGLGGDVTEQSWPVYDQRWLVEDEVEIVLQVNGKVRDHMKMSIFATNNEVEAAALANPRINELVAGKSIRKVVVVPKKLVNIVV